MNAGLVVISIALAAGLSAGCDKSKQASDSTTPAVPNAASRPLPQVSSNSAEAEKAKAPIQGQVDPKEPAQRRDFQTK